MVNGQRAGAACLFLGSVVALVAAGACSAANSKFGDGTGGNGATAAGGGGGFIFTGTGGGGNTTVVWPPCDQGNPSSDQDGDGVTPGAGDCNDCTDLVNPGAMDYPGNTFDEDCNGVPDDASADCDAGIGVGSSDPMDGARAIGLCKVQQGASWGVVSAAYGKADGTSGNDPLGHGIVAGFGPYVHTQEGARMLALSSGTARQPTDSGWQSPSGYDKGYSSGAPAGYPKESPSCPGVTTGTPFDSEQLYLRVRTPSNAKSFSFNFNFYTYEFPNYICSQYNDFFVAYLTPKLGSLPDGNISFDSQQNTISVNAGFLQVCEPQTAGGKVFPCQLGSQQLTGTGFEGTDPVFDPGHAATGWLVTSAPLEVAAGLDIELRFAIWDSGDGVLDSTVLIDNFQWSLNETPTGTEPVDIPK
ncbi:MAG: choice-of-anchor L domain-containing protein [Myxococcales bacterium]|nr:choice-of-anchor L domain-containing protein [Myxococcales bacterium]